MPVSKVSPYPPRAYLPRQETVEGARVQESFLVAATPPTAHELEGRVILTQSTPFGTTTLDIHPTEVRQIAAALLRAADIAEAVSESETARLRLVAAV